MIPNSTNKEETRKWLKTQYDNLQSFLSGNEWVVIGFAWVFTYLLCCIGIYKQFAVTGDIRSPLDPLYRAFQLFFFDDSMSVTGIIHNWQLELGRFLAPAVATYTALQH